MSAFTLPLACAQSYTFVIFDVPGAARTRANGINNNGQIAGTWTDSANHTHGFLRSADGSTFTPIDPPNAVPDSVRVNGINNLGQVVGSYWEAGTNLFHGFVWSASAGFSTFDVTSLGSSVPWAVPGTDAASINDRGDIVGPLSTFIGGNGYLRTADGTLTLLQAPFLGNLVPASINNKGEISGSSRIGGSPGTGHGFLRSPEGTFTQFDFPGTFTSTALTGRNNLGQFVGYVQGGAFVSQSDGTFELLPAYVTSINDSGRMAGYTGSHGCLGLPGAPSTEPSIYNYPLGVQTALGFGGYPFIASGTWIEIYGRNLAPTTRPWRAADFAGALAPTSLEGVAVSINGVPAIVSYISPGQVNALVPEFLPSGTAQVVVKNGSRATASYPIELSNFQPSLLRLAPTISVNSTYVAAVFPDFATFALPPTYTTVPTRRARAGDTIIFFATGLGPVSPAIPPGAIATGPAALMAPVRVSFTALSGIFIPAKVTYAGVIPGTIGLYQINVVVPDIGLSAGMFDDYGRVEVWVGDYEISFPPLLFVPLAN